MARFAEPTSHPPAAPPACSPWASRLPAAARRLLDQLVATRLLAADDAGPFLEARFDRLAEYTTAYELGRALVEASLLTPFQLERVLAGGSHGLLLGNYRVLEQIGSAGMGLGYPGDRTLPKRPLALNVLPS